MKNEQDYIRDIAEIRSMMERSTKFLSLSGWAGIMAGIYALTGAFVASKMLNFSSGEAARNEFDEDQLTYNLLNVMLLAVAVLILAIGTAIFLSNRKAVNKGEKSWNATSRRLLAHMAIPLVTGGILILVFISKGFIEFLPSLSLIFYGLSLYNAGKFTFDEIRILGLIQVALGLISSWFIDYGVIIWAAGFGVVHIIYGIFIHIKYER